MTTDELLQQCRNQILGIRMAQRCNDHGQASGLALALVSFFAELDTQLSHKGPLPTPWKRTEVKL